MKIFVRLPVAVMLLCLAGWRGAFGQQPPGTASLLPNGDFARADATGDWPEGWGVRTPGNGVTWETDGGRRFLRLITRTPGQIQTLYRSTKLTPGQVAAMNVKVRYRAVGVQPGPQPGQDARVWIAFEDADGRTLDTPNPPLLLAPAANWTEVSAPMLVPATATRWILVAGLLHAAAGTVDIGEITALPLGASEAAALAARAPKTSAPVESWVSNGNFSQPDADGQWPQDWGKPEPGMSWQTGDGTRFVRVVSQSPGQSLMLSKTVALKPGVRGIELLVRWRADGVEHGEHEWFDARSIVHFAAADGQQLPAPGGDIVFTHKPAPTGWKESVRSYPVPGGAVALQLMLGLFKARAGTVDLAEVRVTPMRDATSALQQITSAAYGAWKADQDAAVDRRIGTEIDAQLAQTGNLVPNGRFDRTDQDGKPTDWSKQLGDGLTWREENGVHFIRVTSDDAAKMRLLYRMIPLKLGLRESEGTGRYRTAGITKGDRLPGDARVVMHYLNGTRFGHLENGKEMTPQPADIELSADARDWTEVRRRYPVAEGATKLQFMPGLWYVPAGGVLDIAELRVAPASDQSPTPAAAPTR